MTEQEARQVLGISENSTWEEVMQVCSLSLSLLHTRIRTFEDVLFVMQKYDVLFENNAKNGSFYLQSKVHRAKECLENVYQKQNQGTS